MGESQCAHCGHVTTGFEDVGFELKRKSEQESAATISKLRADLESAQMDAALWKGNYELSVQTSDKLRADLKEAAEALRPFAAHAPKWDWRGADADGNKIGLDGSVVVKSRPGDLSIADFRRAASFIAQHKEPDHG